MKPATWRCRFIMANRPRRSLLFEPKFGNSQAKKASLKTDGDEWNREQKNSRQRTSKRKLDVTFKGRKENIQWIFKTSQGGHDSSLWLTAVSLQVKPGLHLHWVDEGLSVLKCWLVCCHNPPPAHHLIREGHVCCNKALCLRHSHSGSHRNMVNVTLSKRPIDMMVGW